MTQTGQTNETIARDLYEFKEKYAVRRTKYAHAGLRNLRNK